MGGDRLSGLHAALLHGVQPRGAELREGQCQPNTNEISWLLGGWIESDLRCWIMCFSSFFSVCVCVFLFFFWLVGFCSFLVGGCKSEYILFTIPTVGQFIMYIHMHLLWFALPCDSISLGWAQAQIEAPNSKLGPGPCLKQCVDALPCADSFLVLFFVLKLSVPPKGALKGATGKLCGKSQCDSPDFLGYFRFFAFRPTAGGRFQVFQFAVSLSCQSSA